MTNEHKKTQMRVLQSILKYMGFLMAVLYVIMGMAVVLKSEILFGIPSQYGKIIGSFMVLYGLFRSYRMYVRYGKKQE
jgi:hypothetical protein